MDCCWSSLMCGLIMMCLCHRLEMTFISRTVGIVAKSSKTLQDALSVVMQKYHLKPQEVSVTMVSVGCIPVGLLHGLTFSSTFVWDKYTWFYILSVCTVPSCCHKFTNSHRLQKYCVWIVPLVQKKCSRFCFFVLLKLDYPQASIRNYYGISLLAELLFHLYVSFQGPQV